MTAPLIEMRGIHRTYVMGDNLVHALRGVDLVIEKGASIAIMGQSGSGKSTMMNIMGCLDQPTQGTYALNGKDVSRLSRPQLADVRGKMIGFVFQSFNLLPRATAVDNVALPLLYSGQPRGARRQAAIEALTRVQLGGRLFHRPDQLSGGQRQRVAIARSLVNRPAVLLADEPTGNLDQKTGAEIVALFEQLHREGVTVMLVTHDHALAQRTNRQIEIVDGRIARDTGPGPSWALARAAG
jgi:putative ABC transport system ATP-binding protein